MKKLNQEEIQKLDLLNNKLKLIEERIYNICLEQNQIALQKILEKENNILDYEIEVQYMIYGDEYIKVGDEEDPEHLLADWTDNIKAILMKDTWWGIHDNNCHNTTSAFQKDKGFNSQKHCWLLHSLYDHKPLDWDDIFKIDSIYFDVQIQYEYLSKISI
ncbi:MAG: hypothetical protein Q9M43_02745 [Sulfurimonas sp.]|nr:hypothetical protein [Sulfurimonas sp.]